MTLCEANKKTFYYKPYAGKTEILDAENYGTGAYTITYGDLVT